MFSANQIAEIVACILLSDDFEFFLFSSKVPEYLHVVLH